jgi:hypothetical protein
MTSITPGAPQTGEYAPFYSGYITKAGQFDDPVARLSTQLKDATAFFSSIPEAKRQHRYAEGKWSVQEILQHLIDAERIFTYRALRFARKDETPLPGFDENTYTPASEADNVPWDELVAEFGHVRNATVSLLRHIPAEAWTRTGISNNNPISVRAIAWVTVGHTEHHMGVIRERYL